MEGDSPTMAFGDMSIEGVDGGVDLSANKPLGEGWIPLEWGIPLTLPDQLSRPLLLEGDPASLGFAIERGLSASLGCKFRARGKYPVLAGKVIEGLFSHNL